MHRRFLVLSLTRTYIAHMSISSERRRAPRVPVSVSLAQRVEGQTHRCVAINLSNTGLYMERPIESFVRHSADVQLEIPIPDGHGEPVLANAEIIYDCFDALSHGTAVRFKSLSARDQARLANWLETNADVDAGGAAGALGSAAA